MTPGPGHVTGGDLQAALWRLLAASDREDVTAFLGQLDDVDDALAARSEPRWTAWRHALAARRAVIDGEHDTVDAELGAAREALDKCPHSAETALTLAYLAHTEVSADHFDTGMLLAIDASLLVEDQPGRAPSKALHQAHRWLSFTLTGLDLEELAVEQAVRGEQIAAQLPDLADRWRMLLLSAQQHAEHAQTLRRRGDTERARELAGEAIDCASRARTLAWEPDGDESDLLDIVQAWATKAAGDFDAALGPMRSARRRIHEHGGVWLRGYADLALGRLLARLAQRDGDAELGEESIALLVDAAGSFVSAGDRRRYRQCLLELGQNSADLGRPAEALHWLEAYRTDTGRAHARSREMWADMFVRRSRLREAERQAALLRRHALEDPLTGLGNRRSAERSLGGLRFGPEPVSLAVVDVDRFKEVNDDTSHTHGDAVLRRVADLLLEHSRADDEVYRWAGDEFLVVLPTATEDQAVGVMERLRSAVAAADWSDLELTDPVTVSIGVATAPATGDGQPTPIGWRTLFDSADLNLFSAKRGGRNRVRSDGAQSGDATQLHEAEE